MSARTWLRIALCVIALAATQGPVTAMSPHPTPSLVMDALPVAWSFINNQVGSRLGSTMSTGDLNGDGHADLVVGAPNGTSPSTTSTSEGVVYVFYGSETGLRQDGEADVILAWGTNGAQFGASVAASDDVNYDGYDDVLVGAPTYKPGDKGKYGAAFLYLGSSTGVSAAPDWIYVGTVLEVEFGASVSFAGSVNDDDYADLIVGAPAYDAASTGGAAFVFYGGPTGPVTETAQMLTIGYPFARYGASVSSAGDVNVDGHDDLLVGAQNYRDTLRSEGAAFLYLGSSTGITTTVAWQDWGGQEYALYGWAVNTVGDINGDARTDIAIGAPGFDDRDADQGQVRVFHGSSLALNAAPSWSFTMPLPYARFGSAIAAAGDMNGDGFGDLVVGAPAYNSDEPENDLSQPVLVFLGSAAGLGDYWAWRFEEQQAITDFGWAVSAGDVDGDGLDDIIIGAPQYRLGGQKCGKVFLYPGSQAQPLPYAVFLPLVLRAAP